MVKIRLPVMVKDPQVAKWKQVPNLDWFTIDEEFVLDGPVSRQVAVVDFDPKSGGVVKGARFRAPQSDKKTGEFVFPQNRLEDPAFLQVTAFGGVMKTIRMFEEPDALGRTIDWAFGGPQLMVVPRAGDWANAFYERNSRSLQLFFFHPGDRRRPVYTCHSQDILAHEATHAILDGIAPDLYGASTPQSLGIHEAVADIGALLMAFRSRSLAKRVLDDCGGRIDQSSAFTGIAEQMASGLRRNGRPLRELRNELKLGDVDESEPHAVSEVLSGALYALMVHLHEDQIAAALGRRKAPEWNKGEVLRLKQFDPEAARGLEAPRARASTRASNDERRRAVAGRAFWMASEIFKRLLLRGLDYLPPGEAGFADLARAMLASDEASFRDRDVRKWISGEFKRRGIVASVGELEVETNSWPKELEDVDLPVLAESDFAAYRFAEDRRALLGIPRGVPFDVRPRLDVTKHYYVGDEREERVRECLFKVSWSEKERIRGVPAGVLPRYRRVKRGTTLAIEWEREERRGDDPWKKVERRASARAILTCAPAAAQNDERDKLLSRLLDEDALRIGGRALGPDGKPLRGVVHAEVFGDTLVPRQMARMLHLMETR